MLVSMQVTTTAPSESGEIPELTRRTNAATDDAIWPMPKVRRTVAVSKLFAFAMDHLALLGGGSPAAPS